MRLVFVLFFICFVNTGFADVKNHPSPYVSMHAKDPVKWKTWDRDTLALAKKEKKLLLLSIGYYSCYWCHVMQRENYNDPVAAELINRHFVPVIIDRELNPSLDAQLNAFVEEINGYAGWPLHVFMTPDGFPILGAVYLPNKNFRQWLQQVQQLWAEQSDFLAATAKDAALNRSHSQTLTKKPITPSFVRSVQQALVKEALENADEMEGGFGVENKFPLPTLLMTLLDILKDKDNAELRQFLILTLNQMAFSGLRDPIDGGFFRYTSDPGWQIPHFEKMLYDNALMASLYLKAGQQFGNDVFIQIGIETIEFMLAKLKTPNGGFASALSAIGKNHIEGEFYLWQKDEIRKLLSDAEYKIANTYWELDQPPIIEDGYLPVVRKAKDTQMLRPLLMKLKQARDQRNLPRDDKQVTSWNALALMALVDGAYIEKRFSTEAGALEKLLHGTFQNGTLKRASIDGQYLGDGNLEDYAYLAYALRHWQQWAKVPDLKLVSTLEQSAWQIFFTDKGWRQEKDPISPYGSTLAMVSDGVLPSPSAVLTQLSLENRQSRFEQQIALALSTGHSLLSNTPFWYPSQYRALELYSKQH